MRTSPASLWADFQNPMSARKRMTAAPIADSLDRIDSPSGAETKRQPRNVVLLAHPARGPLLQEGRDAFLCVQRHRVHGHDLLRVGVRLGLVEVDLRVVGLLADRKRDWAGLGDAQGKGACLLAQGRRWHYLV